MRRSEQARRLILAPHLPSTATDSKLLKFSESLRRLSGITIVVENKEPRGNIGGYNFFVSIGHRESRIRICQGLLNNEHLTGTSIVTIH
jgi:hypothetical protein